MSKCYFYLSTSTHALEQLLGLEYMDAESAIDYALKIAQEFQADPSYQTFFVVVMDQQGNKMAAAPVAVSFPRATKLEDTREFSHA